MIFNIINNAINAGKGVFQLLPNWIPRKFNKPGKRLRLHPDDYLGFGIERGYIEERWLSSTTCVQLGATYADEGLSYINFEDGSASLRDAVDQLGSELIGEYLQKEYGRYPVFSKFYDYYHPSFHHVHHMKEAAERVGAQPKPEAYYFAPQMNLSQYGSRPISFFGFEPNVTKEQVMGCLENYAKTDNHIIELSRAYPLTMNTGWFTPAGVLHSTGSLCTYEPQWCSDVSSIWQNVDANMQRYDYSNLASYVPEGRENDLEYIFSIIDWDANTDPDYKKKYFRPQIVCSETEEHVEKWITYGTGNLFAAKELTVKPGEKYISKEKAAYGCIIIQGFGKFGVYDAETANMVRFGQPTADEYFVSEKAAREGITIANHSKCEPMVILKHFAMNCGMPF